MMRSLPFYAILFFVSFVAAEKYCPPNSQFCYETTNYPQTWNETRARCIQSGADLPGPDHLVSDLIEN